LAVLLAGIILLARAIWFWGKIHFGEMPSMEENLRRLIPAATLVILGIQGIFSSFFMSALGLKTKGRKPPAL
ncbi:MAG: glycosyltransferase family 2 protein, partial [Limisphaerales bacterium]